MAATRQAPRTPDGHFGRRRLSGRVRIDFVMRHLIGSGRKSLPGNGFGGGYDYDGVTVEIGRCGTREPRRATHKCAVRSLSTRSMRNENSPDCPPSYPSEVIRSPRLGIPLIPVAIFPVLRVVVDVVAVVFFG